MDAGAGAVLASLRAGHGGRGDARKAAGSVARAIVRLADPKLRDELETVASLDSEFALFMQAEKRRTERVFQRARMLKIVVTLISFGLLIAAIAWGISLLVRNPQLLQH